MRAPQRGPGASIYPYLLTGLLRKDEMMGCMRGLAQEAPKYMPLEPARLENWAVSAEAPLRKKRSRSDPEAIQKRSEPVAIQKRSGGDPEAIRNAPEAMHCGRSVAIPKRSGGDPEAIQGRSGPVAVQERPGGDPEAI